MERNNMERNNAIDFARGIAIIVVTMGHILGSFHNIGGLFVWGYSFELPLFFLLSGWLTSIGNEQISFCRYAGKKSKSILLPYLEFSIIYMIIHGLGRLIRNEDIFRRLIQDCVYTFSGVGMGAIWFLPSFFLASLMAFIVIRYYVNGGGTSVSPSVRRLVSLHVFLHGFLRNTVLSGACHLWILRQSWQGGMYCHSSLAAR